MSCIKWIKKLIENLQRYAIKNGDPSKLKQRSHWLLLCLFISYVILIQNLKQIPTISLHWLQTWRNFQWFRIEYRIIAHGYNKCLGYSNKWLMAVSSKMVAPSSKHDTSFLYIDVEYRCRPRRQCRWLIISVRWSSIHRYVWYNYRTFTVASQAALCTLTSCP